MVDMKEILGGLLKAFMPFVGKAIITIVILGTLGLLIDIAAHKIRNRKKMSAVRRFPRPKGATGL